MWKKESSRIQDRIKRIGRLYLINIQSKRQKMYTLTFCSQYMLFHVNERLFV